MSLDVFLREPEKESECRCCECGNKHLSKTKDEHFSANITHNLNNMAQAAGVYKEIWRPEELSIKTAAQLIGPLTEALGRLNAEPEKFRKFNPKNDWGNYEVFVEFVRKYLLACTEHPNAEIFVWR